MSIFWNSLICQVVEIPIEPQPGLLLWTPCAKIRWRVVGLASHPSLFIKSNQPCMDHKVVCNNLHSMKQCSSQKRLTFPIFQEFKCASAFRAMVELFKQNQATRFLLGGRRDWIEKILRMWKVSLVLNRRPSVCSYFPCYSDLPGIVCATCGYCWLCDRCCQETECF